MQKAIYIAREILLSGNLSWLDLDAGAQPATPEIFGDVVLARKDEFLPVITCPL